MNRIDIQIRNSRSTFSEYGIWMRSTRDVTLVGNVFHSIPLDPICDDGINTRILPKILSSVIGTDFLSLTASGIPNLLHTLEVSYDLEHWDPVTNIVSSSNAIFTVNHPLLSEGDPSDFSAFRIAVTNTPSSE